MKRIIENWVHIPGKHCGSTALSDLTHFYNIKLSEEMCFGLGSGLGFFYIKGDIFNPTHCIMTRSATLEANFFNNIGIPFNWRIEKDPAKAIEVVEKYIDQNIPVILQTDIYYIDYYKSSSHFNGHIVIQWGYDKKEGKAYLSDTHWEGLQEISYNSLQKARSSNFPPVILENNYFEVPALVNNLELKNLIKNAIVKQAKDMLENADEKGFMGIGGMKHAGKDMESWKNAKDWQWCARFSYQVIERRGTGGGGFRLMYGRFLKEAEEFIPGLKQHGFSDRMLEIARQWTELSEILKRISENAKPDGFDSAGKKLLEIAKLEEGFYQDILRI